MDASQQYSNRPKGHLLPNLKLKFLDQCREVMRFKHLSYRTEEAYIHWIRRFILFHRKKGDAAGGDPRPTGGWVWRHPRDMSEVEVREFLTDLAVRQKVSAGTQYQAFRVNRFAV